MSKTKYIWLLMVTFLTIFISGCQCSDNQIEIMEMFNDTPVLYEIVSTLLPTFTFHNSEGCDPDNYSVFIREYASHGGSYFLQTPDESTTYTMTGIPLEPGHEYIWRVAANEDSVLESEFSDPTIFYTGPVCSGEPLVAPYLVVPMEDAWVTAPDPIEFRWNNLGDCLPDHYDYQFATDPGFTNVIKSGPTFQTYAQHISLTFPDCSTVYWHIRANDGVTSGPWSDTSMLQVVRDGTCFQNHYISDDAARIYVKLYFDQCSQTGDNSNNTPLLDTGCKEDEISNILVGDGDMAFPSDYYVGDFEVSLGSGACPSTGLDHKKQQQLPFYVLAPGIYCVSITRNQSIDYMGYNLMDGIWTEPRTIDVIAYKTVELGPGTSDEWVDFGWDEHDHVFLQPQFDITLECRLCPDPIGPVTGFLMAEQPVPIYGRDTNSEWKLSQVNGVPCYALLPDALINQALLKIEGLKWRAEDLEFYPQPAPCPEPEQIRACSSYNNQSSCENADCTWTENRVTAGGTCSTK